MLKTHQGSWKTPKNMGSVSPIFWGNKLHGSYSIIIVPISMDFLGQKQLGKPMVCLFGHGTDRLAIEILLYTWRFRMLDTSVYPINAGSYGKSPCLMGLNRYIMVYLF